jgi:poly-D-alanine transfer protein DltD
VPDNFSDGIDFFWSTGGDEGYFAVLRKAEGESKWTCVSKKYYDHTVYSMNNGVEYRGFVYTDKKVKKGVKYTYTVRRYDPNTKEYVSYYNTKGVSTKP